MRVLLVEDDALLAQGIREGLERGGFSVDRLAAAEPAESALSLTHYDLAILDIGLPGMDGHELVRRIRARKLGLPILMLTARDGLEDRVRGLDLGSDDYMTKPCYFFHIHSFHEISFGFSFHFTCNTFNITANCFRTCISNCKS